MPEGESAHLKLLLDTQTVRVATVGSLVLADSIGWRSSDPDFNPHMVQAVAGVVDNHGTVQILARSLNTHPPTQEGRAGYRKMFNQHGSKITTVHFAIEDTGFFASAMRSAVSALATIGLMGAPLHAHKTLEQAFDSLARQHPEHLPVRSAVLEFFASHPAQPAAAAS